MRRCTAHNLADAETATTEHHVTVTTIAMIAIATLSAHNKYSNHMLRTDTRT
jgi:hypothetical protein